MTLYGWLYLLGLYLFGPLLLYLALAALRGRMAWVGIAILVIALAYPWYLGLWRRYPFGEHDIQDSYLYLLLLMWTLPVVGAAFAQGARPFLRSRRAYWTVVLALPAVAYAASYP